MVLGAKAPVPEVVHWMPPATEKVPVKLATGLLAQTFWLEPMLTVGAVVILTLMLALTAGQVPLEVDVKVYVTSPAVLSAAVGT